MTQMLLFDAPSTKTAVAPIVSVTPVSAAASESLRGSGSQTASGTDTPEPHVRGLNRMGDLARLVLLRHDLVAAERIQRRSVR